MNNILYLKDFRESCKTQHEVEEAAQQHIAAGREWVIQRFIRCDPYGFSDVYENVLEHPPMTKEESTVLLKQVSKIHIDAEFRAHRIRAAEWRYWV